MNELLKDHFFWKYPVRHTSVFSLGVEQLYEGVKTLLNFTYMAILIIAFVHLFNANEVATSKLVDPLWPLFFLKQEQLIVITFFLQISLILSTVFVIIRNTQFLRIYVFVMYFLYAALLSSFGKINHGLHFVLIPLFCFAFIPNAYKPFFKEKAILIFLSAKFFLLVAYFLTGFWKLFWGVIELFTQDVSLFSPLAFRNVLIQQFQVRPVTVFGAWFMEHYFIGWLLYLFVVYLELFAIAIFFKPNLYKIWGAALIFMKLGLALVMDVNNYIAVSTIGILLMLSPFYQETSWRKTILSLPIIDWFALLYFKKR